MVWRTRYEHSSFPDFGKILASRFPNCQHHLLSDEGGSLLWTQAEAILADIQQHTA